MSTQAFTKLKGGEYGISRAIAWGAVSGAAALLALTMHQFGPFAAAALIAACCVLVLLVRLPWIGVVLLVASVPVQEFGAIAAGGQSLTLTRAMLPLALAGYIMSIIVRRDRLSGTRMFVPYGVLVLLVLLSAAWASSISTALAEAARWLIAFTAFVVLVHFTVNASRRRLTAIVLVMAAAGVFQATYGVTQSVLAIGPESFRVGTQGSRAFGTFGQPNSYAGYLEMVFFPVFWLALYFLTRVPVRVSALIRARRFGMVESRDERLDLMLTVALTAILGGSALLILSGIVASYSRGAWLGIAAGGVVTMLLYHAWVRRGLLLAAPLLVLVMLGGASAVLPEAMSERVTTGFADLRPFDASSIPVTDENFAAAERMAHWQAGWRMFDDQPLSGVGAGNFNVQYSDYFVREQFQFSRGHAHNFYIHLLAEVGIVGLVLYLWLISSVAFMALVVIIRARHGFERMLALGAFGTIVSVGVHNVFENLHVLNLGIQIGAVWALAIAAHRQFYRRDTHHPVSE